MILTKRFYLLILIGLIPLILFGQDNKEKLQYPDGPYIFRQKDRIKTIQVLEQGLSVKENMADNISFPVISHSGEIKFDVKLHIPRTPQWKYDQRGDILVISDPHGNLEAFVSILQAQNVINEHYEWSFGTNHLVVIGDVFDRGNDVLPIFWLIYKLEEEARNAGGCVHFLYGNHEDLVLRNDVRYMNDKYNLLAKELNIKHSQLWYADSELGYWLKNRNTIEIIGDNLIVHAGLSKEFLDGDWDIPEVNEIMQSYIGVDRKERNKNKKAEFLFGSDGPIWYRGMVHSEEKYNPIAENDVDAILNKYNVNRIYVGHTIFDDVTTFYNGKVIAVNVNNKKNMENGLSRGVLIKNGKKYLIYDNPSKNKEME